MIDHLRFRERKIPNVDIERWPLGNASGAEARELLDRSWTVIKSSRGIFE
jgi:hypothetical protein